MNDDDTDREEGVDFAEVNPVLEELSYPITTEELVEQHGDRELGRTNADPISLRELFEYMGEDTFESPEGARQMIMSQMPRESVGRRHYSDRGGNLPGEGDAEDEHPTAADVQGGPASDRDVDADGDVEHEMEEDETGSTDEE